MDERASLSVREYFAGQHLAAAALCARSARTVDIREAGRNGYFADHRSYVIGSVLFAVASLEAGINELFTDASEGNLGRLRPLDEGAIKRMGEMWLLGVPRTARYGVAEKYAIAIRLTDKKPFDKSAEPWQSIAKLIKLRNALVHYEPTWVPSDSTKQAGEEHAFEKLFARMFPLNPLAPEGNPFYPGKLLGHGCAAWSVRSVMTFMDSFKDRLQLLAGVYGGPNDPEFAIE